MSWEFGDDDCRTGTISCNRAVGSKQIPVDVIALSETGKVRVYLGVEGKTLTSADLAGEWTPGEEGLELGERVAELLDLHGPGTTLTLGLANWGTEDIGLEDPCLGLAYVVDQGQGFVSMEFSGTDDRTIFPGSMGLFTLDPEGEDEGFLSLDLQDGGEIVIAWGEGQSEDEDDNVAPSVSESSGGCNGTGGLPWVLLFGLPMAGLISKKQR